MEPEPEFTESPDRRQWGIADTQALSGSTSSTQNAPQLRRGIYGARHSGRDWVNRRNRDYTTELEDASRVELDRLNRAAAFAPAHNVLQTQPVIHSRRVSAGHPLAPPAAELQAESRIVRRWARLVRHAEHIRRCRTLRDSLDAILEHYPLQDTTTQQTRRNRILGSTLWLLRLTVVGLRKLRELFSAVVRTPQQRRDWLDVLHYIVGVAVGSARAGAVAAFLFQNYETFAPFLYWATGQQ
jgi:hypothetical protein